MDMLDGGRKGKELLHGGKGGRRTDRKYKTAVYDH